MEPAMAANPNTTPPAPASGGTQGGADRNFIGLLAANTILGSVMPMLIILGGLAGLLLAPSPALATLPPSVQTLAGLLLMGRRGRRFGFLVGGLAAMTGGALGVLALLWSTFALLLIAHALLGAALACYLYFRFAAAEVVSTAWQPVAISLVLTSGLIAAFVEPQVFIWTKDLLAPRRSRVPTPPSLASPRSASCRSLLCAFPVRAGPQTAPGPTAPRSERSCPPPRPDGRSCGSGVAGNHGPAHGPRPSP